MELIDNYGSKITKTFNCWIRKKHLSFKMNLKGVEFTLKLTSQTKVQQNQALKSLKEKKTNIH